MHDRGITMRRGVVVLLVVAALVAGACGSKASGGVRGGGRLVDDRDHRGGRRDDRASVTCRASCAATATSPSTRPQAGTGADKLYIGVANDRTRHGGARACSR